MDHTPRTLGTSLAVSPGRLLAAVPSPLDGGLGVAVSPLAVHCTSLLSNGCDGIVLFGTTGEGTHFSTVEKISALKALIESGVPAERLVLASGSCALDDAVTAVRAAHDLGCSGTLVLPPFFTKSITDEGLAKWFDELVSRCGGHGAIYLYHIPQVAGVGFSGSLAARLLDKGGIVRGVKDSTPDSSLAAALVREKRSGIYVSTECDLAANLERGVAGVISASLSVTLPLVRRALTSADGKTNAAVTALRAHLARHSLIWAVKAALAAQYDDPVWRSLAPPHCVPLGADEPTLLNELHETAVAVL